MLKHAYISYSKSLNNFIYNINTSINQNQNQSPPPPLQKNIKNCRNVIFWYKAITKSFYVIVY